MKFKRSIFNIIAGIISQSIIILLGFFIPRLLIYNYGSEINGLLTSVTQIYSYMALMEAGIGQACVQALYSYIVNNDIKSISSIINAATNKYKKIAVFYFIGICCFAVIYPNVVQTAYSSYYIAKIIFITGLSSVVNFYGSMALQQLLIAEGKAYVISNISLVIHILRYLSQIILINNGFDVVNVQLVYCLVGCLQCILVRGYFKRHYSWFIKTARPNYSALRQSNAFLIHQISSLVFSSTDTFLLTLFTSLNTVSIYAVYNTVISAINVFCSTLNNALTFVLGHLYYENQERYIKIFDAYNIFYISAVYTIITVSYFLYLPFVQFYTQQADINYSYYGLPLLFCIIQLLSSARAVSNNLINIAGHTAKTVPRTLIEAIINIMISIITVQVWGIYGVLIGTICALLYRTNDIIIYANRIILNRSPKPTYYPFILNSIIFIILGIFRRSIQIHITTFYELLIVGIKYGFCIAGIFILVNLFFFHDSVKFIVVEIKKHLKRKTIKNKE